MLSRLIGAFQKKKKKELFHSFPTREKGFSPKGASGLTQLGGIVFTQCCFVESALGWRGRNPCGLVPAWYCMGARKCWWESERVLAARLASGNIPRREVTTGLSQIGPSLRNHWQPFIGSRAPHTPAVTVLVRLLPLTVTVGSSPKQPWKGGGRSSGKPLTKAFAGSRLYTLYRPVACPCAYRTRP